MKPEKPDMRDIIAATGIALLGGGLWARVGPDLAACAIGALLIALAVWRT